MRKGKGGQGWVGRERENTDAWVGRGKVGHGWVGREREATDEYWQRSCYCMLRRSDRIDEKDDHLRREQPLHSMHGRTDRRREGRKEAKKDGLTDKRTLDCHSWFESEIVWCCHL